MHSNDLVSYRKTYSASPPGMVSLVEFGLDLGQILFAYAAARVGHVNLNVLRVGHYCLHGYHSALVGVLDSVVDNVNKDLPDTVLVAVHKRQHIRLLVKDFYALPLCFFGVDEHRVPKLGKNVHSRFVKTEPSVLHT